MHKFKKEDFSKVPHFELSKIDFLEKLGEGILSTLKYNQATVL
jgi:hypothetical protein